MALDELDRNGIASLGPVDGSNSDEHRGQARDWNEWGTRICLQHPGRFGLFATLSLLDPTSHFPKSRTPIHGVSFSTSNGGFWLGDKRNASVFAELSRRKAVIFVQP